MIVVDTNVIASLYLETERTREAEHALLKDGDWAVPVLWRSEFRSVLAVSVQKERFDLAHALKLVEAAENQLQDREFMVPSLNVLRLATESGCSAYDCEFVALAQDLSVPLVTLDTQVLAAFPDQAIALGDFAN